MFILSSFIAFQFVINPIVDSKIERKEVLIATTTAPIILSTEEQEIQTLPETQWSTTTLAYLITKTFPDAPVMLCIAQAESQLRQYQDGEVLRGSYNPQDRGLYQINEHYHLANSKSLGYDIYTVKGNIAYARYLYDRNGTRDWNWSRDKWEDCLR